jgi:hypothetical protein
MSTENQDVAAVLDAIGAAGGRFRELAESFDSRFDFNRANKPNWAVSFDPKGGSVDCHASAHLPAGTVSWSISVLWRPGLDWPPNSPWRVIADQTWNFWYPWDGPWPLRETEWFPSDARDLATVIAAALDDINRWVDETNFDVVSVQTGVDPDSVGYDQAHEEICRRFGASGGGGACA